MYTDDPNKDMKFEVWNAMHAIIKAIDENRIDSETINSLVWTCKMVAGSEELGWGVQPIYPDTWKALVRVNEEEDIGIDEMVHVGVDLYFDAEGLREHFEDD
jgi:hypothetical protein